MKLKEIEQNIFGKPNCGSKLLIIDYGKSMIKAILHEFSGEWLFQYSNRAYRIFHGDSKKDNFSRTFIHVCAYHFLQMGRRKIKKILKITRNNPQIHFVQQFFGRLICYIGVEEVRRFVKDIYIVLNTKRRTDLVEYHIPCKTDEEKFNNFDYGEADLIELNADEDDHVLFNGQLAENEDEEKSISSANQQLSVSGKATGINDFQIIKNVY